jgi:hypothetical protein
MFTAMYLRSARKICDSSLFPDAYFDRRTLLPWGHGHCRPVNGIIIGVPEGARAPELSHLLPGTMRCVRLYQGKRVPWPPRATSCTKGQCCVVLRTTLLWYLIIQDYEVALQCNHDSTIWFTSRSVGCKPQRSSVYFRGV